MHSNILAQRAYGATQTAAQLPRRSEALAIDRATRALIEAEKQRSIGLSQLAAAIHLNRQLWSALAMDVADPANALPDHIKAQVLYLAEFTQAYSGAVLREKASAQPLVDINIAISGGLNGLSS